MQHYLVVAQLCVLLSLGSLFQKRGVELCTALLLGVGDKPCMIDALLAHLFQTLENSLVPHFRS